MLVACNLNLYNQGKETLWPGEQLMIYYRKPDIYTFDFDRFIIYLIELNLLGLSTFTDLFREITIMFLDNITSNNLVFVFWKLDNLISQFCFLQNLTSLLLI